MQTIKNGHEAFEIINVRISEVMKKIKAPTKRRRNTKDRKYSGVSNSQVCIG